METSDGGGIGAGAGRSILAVTSGGDRLIGVSLLCFAITPSAAPELTASNNHIPVVFITAED